MPQDKIERALRIKYAISQTELARAIGISRMRLIEIEQWDKPSTAHHLHLLQRGFAAVIRNRREQLNELEQDFCRYFQRLTEPLPDGRGERLD